MCYPVSWFLGLLFQFQLLGPWVGLLAAKSPRLTVVALLCLCTASYMLSAYLTETREFRLNPMDTINGYNRWANECTCPCCVVGLKQTIVNLCDACTKRPYSSILHILR